MKFKVHYYKESGKYYTSGDLAATDAADAGRELAERKQLGELPGLIPGCKSEFVTLILPEDEDPPLRYASASIPQRLVYASWIRPNDDLGIHHPLRIHRAAYEGYGDIRLDIVANGSTFGSLVLDPGATRTLYELLGAALASGPQESTS